MQIKYLFILLFSIILYSCNNNDDGAALDNNENGVILSERILSEYLELNSDRELDEVIACAGSNEDNLGHVNVYYLPISGSSEIRYYETDSLNVDPNDFSNYTIQEDLPVEGVFGNKLEFFLRTKNYESWGIVTFLTEGRIHRSNPIRFKQLTIPTEFSSDITIDQTQPTSPKFTWPASDSLEDVIYFQGLVENGTNFVSGTYTTELCFRYHDTNNVVLTINDGIPPNINISSEYEMNILAVSIDNWVNLFLRRNF